MALSDAPRPPSVTRGLYALSIALVLGVAILSLAWGVPPAGFVTLVLVGSLILGTGRGNDWARLALTALTLVAFIYTSPLVWFQLTYGVLVPVATAAQIALEIVGCYLLFRAPAGLWYSRARRADA